MHADTRIETNCNTASLFGSPYLNERRRVVCDLDPAASVLANYVLILCIRRMSRKSF